MKDLEAYPTADLVDELISRCAPAIFIGTRYEGETGERSWQVFRNYRGNLDCCRGMLAEMDSFLLRSVMREEYEREDSEED